MEVIRSFVRSQVSKARPGAPAMVSDRESDCLASVVSHPCHSRAVTRMGHPHLFLAGIRNVFSLLDSRRFGSIPNSDGGRPFGFAAIMGLLQQGYAPAPTAFGVLS